MCEEIVGNAEPDTVKNLNDFLKTPEIFFGRGKVPDWPFDSYNGDWLWRGLVRSFGTWQGAWCWEQQLEPAYERWSWQNLPDGEEEVNALFTSLLNAQSENNKRLPRIMSAYRRISGQFGGIKEAQRRALFNDDGMPKNYNGKRSFIGDFDGIGPKYSVNFWMDFRDPDFEQCFAIDGRYQDVLKNGLRLDIGKHFNVKNGNQYDAAQRALLRLIEDSGRSGWEADRLIFQAVGHDRDAFICGIRNGW